MYFVKGCKSRHFFFKAYNVIVKQVVVKKMECETESEKVEQKLEFFDQEHSM